MSGWIVGHPHHCKILIPYGQALRSLRWICSTESHLRKWTRKLKKYLLKRGYWEQRLNTKIHRALAVSRENCSQQQPNQAKTARIQLVVTYHPSYHLLNWSPSATFQPFIPRNDYVRHFSLPPSTAFRRLRNLRNFLVWATLTAKTFKSPANRPCGAAWCKTSPTLVATDEFTSHKTGQVCKWSLPPAVSPPTLFT